jgi:hypothetical protein
MVSEDEVYAPPLTNGPPATAMLPVIKVAFATPVHAKPATDIAMIAL